MFWIVFIFQEICKYVVSSAGDGSSISPENAYYITTTWQALGSCNALPKNNLIKVSVQKQEKNKQINKD